MKIEWLECLVALKKYNSIAKAAETCFTTTQNFGKIIKNLESELGFDLIRRDGRNLMLTDAALDFAESAEKMIMTIEQTKLKYGDAEPSVTGTIDLIANDFDTIEFILDRFVANYPGVTVALNEMEITQAFQYIKDHTQTLAILPIPDHREHSEFYNYYDFLDIIPLCKEQTVCLVSKYSKYVNYKTIRYEDLAQEKLVAMCKSAYGSNYHTQFLNDKFAKKKKITTTNSFNYFFAGISKNLFIGINVASDYNSAPYVYKDNIVAIPVEEEKQISKSLVYHAHHKKFSEAERFLIKEIEAFYHKK